MLVKEVIPVLTVGPPRVCTEVDTIAEGVTALPVIIAFLYIDWDMPLGLEGQS